MPALGAGRGEGHRPPWGVVLLTLTAITSSSLSVLSLHHVLALQAEVEVLRSEVSRRREEQSGAAEEIVGGRQVQEQEQEDREETFQEINSFPQSKSETDQSKGQKGPATVKKRSLASESDRPALHSCLQLMADSKRTTFQKKFALEPHTGVPWQTGLKRGSALEEDKDTMLVKEEGFFFVYSQVYYTDSTFAMGHIVIRMKRNVVGDESQFVTLFRCIQSMNPVVHYNTCYTGGVVKLEVGDRVELLIPRATANISLDGDSTFLGAVKLG
ncbi:tumor necrosis factor ligand superfamily member 13B [Chanos chanos]|uniref:Tumor necrosis factor ligand superfamily member 13B n=1 Tax=Chanos chanos TaxID=29144 RepID=A0A6J2WJE8_CHACN|nr:tumor necrosis factor ligand superfamily member 13B [Chanos chanos]